MIQDIENAAGAPSVLSPEIRNKKDRPKDRPRFLAAAFLTGGGLLGGLLPKKVRAQLRPNKTLSESVAVLDRVRQTTDVEKVALSVATDLEAAVEEHALVTITDPKGEITFVNDKFCAISQYSREELLGQNHRLISSGGHSKEFYRDLWTTIASGRVWRGDVQNRAKDGSSYWVDTTIVPFLDERGRPRRYVSIRADITARKRAETAMLERGQRAEFATQATKVGIWEWQVPTNKLRWDAQMFRIYGVQPTDDGVIDPMVWTGAVLPEDLAQQVDLFEKIVRECSPCNREFRIRRKDDGECRIIHAVETIRMDAQGQVEWVVGTNLDVTDQKKAEDQIRLLIGEQTHRSKNLLGIVQSMALLSADSADPAAFALDLSKRISGLSACQDLLLSSEWKGVGVADLARAELRHFGDLIGNRILLTGQAVRLCPTAAQGIGMALHELATNATKYGALSDAAGRVRIDWSVAASDQGPMFTMQWREENGPKVVAPTRKGFGQKVIVTMAEYAVKGKADIEYCETGVCWTLRAPVRFALEAN